MEIGSSSSTTTNTESNHNKTRHASHRCRNICLIVTGVIIVLVLILVILGLTVFKPKRTVTTINSVKLGDLGVSFDLWRLKVYLNLSINVDLSIKNPNSVGFKYKNSSAILYYRGGVVGEVPILGDKINPGETMPMNVTLTLIADRLLSKTELFNDVLSGTLPVSTYTRISGKVIILSIIKVHVVSVSSCDVNINVSSSSVSDSHCKYKTKL